MSQAVFSRVVVVVCAAKVTKNSFHIWYCEHKSQEEEELLIKETKHISLAAESQRFNLHVDRDVKFQDQGYTCTCKTTPISLVK